MDEYTEPNESNFLPALVATGVWLSVGAALDVYLVATNKSHLISDVLRTKPGKVFMIVLSLHVMNVLGRADPFSATARAIQTRGGVTSSALARSLSDSPPISQ